MSAVDRRLRGVCPVLAVPFTDGGDVDVDGFAAVVDLVWRAGATAATLFGLASEFPKLTEPERVELMDVFLTRSAGPDVCAVISVTDHSTEVAVRRAAAAQAAGADVVNVLPPHFLSPSPAAVVGHLDQVLSAVSIPVMVQYAPAQTGTSISVDALLGLQRRHPHLSSVALVIALVKSVSAYRV